MENKLCAYETLYVVSGALSEEDAKATIEKFTALIAQNGEIVKVTEWGKRRLAYPINKIVDGYYVLTAFNSAAEFPLELERVFGISDAILRFMTVRVEKHADAVAPVAEEAPVAEAE